MNIDSLSGQWKQLKGAVKEKWGKLTDDDVTRAEGNYEKLLGIIQERYGYARERAQSELDGWMKSAARSAGDPADVIPTR